jgi:hypothetical protein
MDQLEEFALGYHTAATSVSIAELRQIDRSRVRPLALLFADGLHQSKRTGRKAGPEAVFFTDAHVKRTRLLPSLSLQCADRDVGLPLQHQFAQRSIEAHPFAEGEA